jgi:uncharacterized protein (TIGR03437 family)
MRHLIGCRFIAATFVFINCAIPGWGQQPGRPQTTLQNFDIRDSAPPADAPENTTMSNTGAILQRRAASMAAFTLSARSSMPGLRITTSRFGLPRMIMRDGFTLTSPSVADPEDIAKRFLRSNSAIFPFSSREIDEMRTLMRDVTPEGTHLAFNQTVGGVDVFEGQVKFTLSRAGEIIQVASGGAAPEFSVSTTPTLQPPDAEETARRLLRAGPAAKLMRDPELVVFPVNAGTARLAWRVLMNADGANAYEVVLDATNGGLLYRHLLNKFASAQGRVWTMFPTQAGARELVTFPDAWLPATSTVTTGNNVDAWLDTNGDNKPDTLLTPNIQNGRATSLDQTFDFPFGDGTQNLDPRLYKAAAVTNLFYFVNMAHDYYYNLGFTEATGNFQTDNLGKGGVGGDPVIAEAQNGLESNNASFQPTPEGTPPHIRMGLFTRGTLAQTDDLDSDYDGQIILHEYGHGVSNRLVGALTATSCLNQIQSGAMGEGWSDYFSISYTNNPVEGVYSWQNSVTGIRRQSYEGYSYTYEDIGNEGYEVHNDGEIWAAALWDLRKSLGKDIMDRLVVNGLKSTPCNPSMTDARDAIFVADVAANQGANRAAIWNIFAKHGLGYSAAGTDGNELTGTVYNAAYDQPPDLQATGNPVITSKPLAVSASAGQSYLYIATATNPNGGLLNYSLASGPAGMTIDSATGVVHWTASFVPQRVKIVVTDGKGGKVVNGYVAPVLTWLTFGTAVTIDGPKSSEGMAYIDVPAGVPILQGTLRGILGDADLYMVDPNGGYESSSNFGSNETLSFAAPKPGRWIVFVDGYATYSGVSLAVSQITPVAVPIGTSLTGLGDTYSGEAFYRVPVPAGTTNLRISTTGGTGDVDLFAKFGSPALCGEGLVSTLCVYDKFSAVDGNEESVQFASPAAGDLYLVLTAWNDYAGVTLSADATLPIALSPATVAFGAIAGTSLALTQDVQLTLGGAVAAGWQAVASVSSGSSWLSVSPAAGSGSATIKVNVNPAGLGVGTYQGTVTVTSGTSTITMPVTLTIVSTGPVIKQGGITGAAVSVPPVTTISPNGYTAVYGSGFAPAGTVRVLQPVDLLAGGLLPTSLGSVCVEVNGLRGYITFFTDSQVNFIAPAFTPGGSANVVVKTGCGSPSEIASLPVGVASQPASPEFLYWVYAADGKSPAIAVNSTTGVYIGTPGLIAGLTFVPAKPGDLLTVYGIGFGPTTPSFPAGSAPTGAGNVASRVVQLAGVPLADADILYAGVAGSAGLYQINIRVPANTPDGTWPLVLTLGNVSTPAGYLAVKQ